jgi:hypothetical protein
MIATRDAEIVSIVTMPEEEGPWPFDLADDRFLKDLGIARGTLIPHGLHILEPFQPISADALAIARETQPADVVAALDADRPWVELHFMQRRGHLFGPEGGRAAHRGLAEFLEANPEFAGAHGGGWLQDPAVVALSPHLRWIGEQDAMLRTITFAVGPDAASTRHALATSATRRAAYEAGTYVPTRWAVVYLRDDVLRYVGELPHD